MRPWLAHVRNYFLLEQAIVAVAAVAAPGGIADVGWCTQALGSDSVSEDYEECDRAANLLVVDVGRGSLRSGTLDSWTLHNNARTCSPTAGSSPIALQVWRPVSKMSWKLICETKAVLKPGLQTISAVKGCDTEDGDYIGWFTGAGVEGGISLEQAECESLCQGGGKCGSGDCSMCDKTYGGVIWNKWGPEFAPVQVGGTFTAVACGPRTYAVSVTVVDLCFACRWGCHVLLLATALSVLYLSLALGKGLERGSLRGHPHYRYWMQIKGLCADGVLLTGSVLMGRCCTSPQLPVEREADGGPRFGSGDHTTAANTMALFLEDSVASVIPRASRGVAGPLHHAASVGDAVKLRQLLSGNEGLLAALNDGDGRRYTAFAVACAGGHTQCVVELLRVGCDTKLCEEKGLSGWELAAQLHRHAVLALRPTTSPSDNTSPSSTPRRSSSNAGERATRAQLTA